MSAMPGPEQTRGPAILRLAADLANPARPANLAAVDPVSLQRAAELLEKQKVSFIPIAERFGDSADGSALAPYIERDAARYRSQREEYEKIRLGFLARGFEPMVFKSTGATPSFHYLSSNLDILVPEHNVGAARDVLLDMGYVELLNVEEPCKFLFRRFTGDGSSFAFHLHGVVGWGVPFLDNTRVWAGARHATDDPGILLPGVSEGLLVTLAHWFYEDKALSLGNLLLTAHALRTIDVALAEPANHARRRGWEEGFWGALCIFDEAWKRLYDEPFLAGEQRAELDHAPARYAAVRARIFPLVRYCEDDVAAAIPFKANKVAYYRKVMRDRGRPINRKVRDVADTLLWAVRWRFHIRSQSPLLVTLSGCDGSGKSLQSERLRDAFHTCDIRTRTVWARGVSSKGASGVMNVGKKVLSGRSNADAKPKVESGEAGRFAERQRRLRNPFARWAFSVVFATDLIWPYVVKTRWALLTGNAVICDRYICDALVDYALFTGTDPAKPPLSLQLLHLLTPRPHVGVLLDVEPAEALRRKPEEGSTAYLEDARRMFCELAQARRMTIMQANASADDVQRGVAHAALTAFYDRYDTLINIVLRSNPGQMNPRED